MDKTYGEVQNEYSSGKTESEKTEQSNYLYEVSRIMFIGRDLELSKIKRKI